MGVTRQKEVAPIFVSARAPREGCSSPSSARPTRAHPRRLQGARSGAAAAPLPTSSGPASFPFPPSCAARACSSTPAERPLCRGGLSGSPPPRLRGETGLPRRPKRQQAPEAAAAAGASREGSQQTPTPHPTPGNTLTTPSPRWTRGATSTREPPAPRLPFSTSRPGLSLPRPHQPPAPALRPKLPPAPPSPGSAGHQGKRRADVRSQLTSKCGGRVPQLGEARRRGKAAPPTPAATGCRSGSQQLADRGASEGQASAAAAAFRLSPRVRSLREGPRGPLRVAKPPGQHGSRAAEPRGRPSNPLGGARAGARRAARRRRLIEAARPNADSFLSGAGRREAEETAGGRFRSLRVRRFLTRRLQTDASACSPEERERERKKTFIETIQPAAAEKTDRPPKPSPPPPERQAGGSATPAGGSGGGGA